MKKLLVILTIGLLVFNAANSSAQYGEGSYSEELDDTEYTWELTTLEGDSIELEEGDEWTIVFQEAPGGRTAEDVNTDDTTEILYNGEAIDFENANISNLSDEEGVAFIIAILWAIPNPSENIENNEEFTVEGDEATATDDGFEIVYNVNSGILEKLDTSEDNERVVLEYQSGFLSSIPVSPIYVIFAVLAIPVIRRIRHH